MTSTRVSVYVCLGLLLAVAVAATAIVTSDRHSQALAVLFEHRPANWFEDLTASARVSPDGRWALYGTAPRLRLIDLRSGKEDAARLRGRFDAIENAVFDARRRLVRLAAVQGMRAWFAEDSVSPLPIPPDGVPAWSTSGRLAVIESTARSAGVLVDGRRLAVPGYLLSIAWSPDGTTLVTTTRADDFTSTLGTLSVDSGAYRIVADGLDADVFPAQFAISPDGREAILALASEGRPDSVVRHDPNADRELDLWAVDLRTGARRRLIAQPGDDFAPHVVQGRLIWTHAEIRPSVVVLPIDGGVPRTIVDRGELPAWSPDGRELAFMIGGWRLRDVALPLDVQVVDVDGEARPRSAPRPFITGYHEDFTPAWSPGGRWLVFHSHRSPSPVPSYSSPGSTDDLWIAPAAQPSAERRLTDFGHEAAGGSWAPDGRRVAFMSHDPAEPSRTITWIVHIDPVTGARVSAERLPLPPEILSTESVAWSPDGDRLALVSKSGSGQQTLWILSLARGVATKIVEYDSPTFGGVDWTPNGRTLVYAAVSGPAIQIFAVDASRRTVRRLTVSNVNVLHPKVSPDGRWVAATALDHVRRVLQTPLASLIPVQ